MRQEWQKTNIKIQVILFECIKYNSHMRTGNSNTKHRKKYCNKKTICIAVGICIVILAVILRTAPASIARIYIEMHKTDIKDIPQQIISVYIDENEQKIDMPLENYIVYVVAGEMPAGYSEEALKAQAVAARTYTVRRIKAFGGSGCDAHGTDICTSSAHCQAYMTESEMHDKWGDSYNEYYDKIKEAAYATAGEIITYGGEPIDALYHAVSGGYTEDAENVYSNSVPYLKSVASPGEENSNNYKNIQRFSSEELVSKLNKYAGGLNLSASRIEDQIKIISRYKSGRVENVKVGSKILSGRQFRSALGLKSTNFTIDFGDSISITTKGYGHGLGMSQAGANYMAESGSNYKEILMHYYTNISFKNIY